MARGGWVCGRCFGGSTRPLKQEQVQQGGEGRRDFSRAEAVQVQTWGVFPAHAWSVLGSSLVGRCEERQHSVSEPGSSVASSSIL